MFEGISPFMIVLGINILVAVAALVFIVVDKTRTKMKIFQFSENEKLYDTYDVDAFSPLALYNTRNHKRFIRKAPSYKSRVGNTIMWLAKRGTAYLFQLQDSQIKVKDGETEKIVTKQVAIKLGTLWEGLKSILGEEMCNEFTNEAKEALMNPEVFITVELESGKTPEGLPDLTEDDVYNETSMRMSVLIFSGIKEALKEDYVKLLLAILAGGGIFLALIRLGVL